MNGWSVFGLGVVRAAGFGIRLVDNLADAGLHQLVLDVLHQSEELDAAASSFLAAAAKSPRPSDRAARTSAERCLRSVARRHPIDAGAPLPAEVPGYGTGEEFRVWWNDHCVGLHDTDARLGARYTNALLTARGHLGRALREEDVRAALVLLTPEILDTIVRTLLCRPPTGPAPNQAERKATAFLQRLAAKCETNGPAGPIGYATFSGCAVPLPPGSDERGYLAYWAAVALAREFLRRIDLRDRPVRLGPLAAQLPTDAPLTRHLQAVVTGTARMASDKVRALHERGLLLVDELTPPSNEPDALAALARIAERAGDAECRAVVNQLADQATKFATGDATTKTRVLSEVNATLTAAGVDVSRRGHGALYADRVALYQENHDRRLELRFADAVTTSLTERLAPVLELAASAGVQAWLGARETFGTSWRAAFGDDRPRGLPEVMRTLEMQITAPVGETPVAAEFQDVVAETWDGTDSEVRLPPESIWALIPEFDSVAPLLLAPDVHLDTDDVRRARDLACQVVIGEIHWGLQGLGNLCCLLPDRNRLGHAVREWLAGVRPELVHVATKDRFGKLCYLELLPRTLELGGRATDGRQPLSATQLEVAADGTVTERATGDRIALLLGDPAGRLQCPLGVPSAALPAVDLGRFTPRISVGDVVVQRATWTVDTRELGADRPAGVRRYQTTVARLAELGVPRRFFAAIAGERKPIYVDLASPHLIDLLTAQARGTAVRLTEMLPGVTGLWQPAGDDRRVCELRLATVRTREQADEEPRCPIN